MDYLKYKGYTSSVEYCEEAGVTLNAFVRQVLAKEVKVAV